MSQTTQPELEIDFTQPLSGIVSDIEAIELRLIREQVATKGTKAYQKALARFVEAGNALIAAANAAKPAADSDEGRFIFQAANALRRLILFCQRAADVSVSFEQIESSDGLTRN